MRAGVHARVTLVRVRVRVLRYYTMCPGPLVLLWRVVSAAGGCVMSGGAAVKVLQGHTTAAVERASSAWGDSWWLWLGRVVTGLCKGV